MKNFDIFQTVGPRDFEIINETLKVNKKNILGYSQIYLFNESKNFNLKKVLKMLMSQYFLSRLNMYKTKLKIKAELGGFMLNL